MNENEKPSKDMLNSAPYDELEAALHPKLLIAIRMINYMSENLKDIQYLPDGNFRFDLPFPDGSYIGVMNEGGIGFTSTFDTISFGMNPDDTPTFRLTDWGDLDCIWVEKSPGIAGLVQFPLLLNEDGIPPMKGPAYIYEIVLGEGLLGSAMALFENLLVELYAKIVASQLGER